MFLLWMNSKMPFKPINKKPSKTFHSPYGCGPNLLHQCMSQPHSPLQTAAQLVHAAYRQPRNKVPLFTMGCPTSIPKIFSSPGAIAIPIYLPHPWIQPTHHPKQHLNPISHFSTIHQTDRRTKWPTDGLGDITCTNTCLRFVDCSDMANNANHMIILLTVIWGRT